MPFTMPMNGGWMLWPMRRCTAAGSSRATRGAVDKEKFSCWRTHADRGGGRSGPRPDPLPLRFAGDPRGGLPRTGHLEDPRPPARAVRRGRTLRGEVASRDPEPGVRPRLGELPQARCGDDLRGMEPPCLPERPGEDARRLHRHAHRGGAGRSGRVRPRRCRRPRPRHAAAHLATRRDRRGPRRGPPRPPPLFDTIEQWLEDLPART